MPRKLRDAVVVITGASSGIGRAAALAFARRGATVVIAARRAQPLSEVGRLYRGGSVASRMRTPESFRGTRKVAVVPLALEGLTAGSRQNSGPKISAK
jgi:NAD(P)-dependent dehydrogenase (short-subunit alcohol dehydrogenase family)